MSTKNNPIRVALVQPALPKYRIPVFRELAQRDGIDLTVYFGTRDDLLNEPAEGFTSVATRLRTYKPLGQIVLVHTAQWRAVNRKQADVVILNWTPRYVTLFPTLFKAKLLGIPIVLWGHGTSKLDRWWWRLTRKAMAKLSTCLLFYSKVTADTFRSEGWPAEKIYVAPNALDGSQILAAKVKVVADPSTLMKFQQEQGLNPKQTLIYVSRLEPANRAGMLVEATAELSKSYPALKTVIIGNGDAERERLVSLAEERGVQDRIIFEKGIYNEEELALWMLSSRIFCYPERIGLSLLHAMWYGLPIVTSDCATCHGPEFTYLKNGVNGLTYEHRNLSDFVVKIRALLEDGTLTKILSNAAFKTVETDINIPRMADGIEAAIRFACKPI